MTAAVPAAARTDRPWRNWAGNQTMRPAAVRRPSSRAELVAAVEQAAAAGQRVKAIGSGHSFSAIGLTDGVLLDLSAYAGLVQADTGTGLVTVQAGMPLHRLNRVLALAGLGLTNMGDIDRQTIAGALSTGTHGTGRDSASLAAQVVALELVLADGTVVTTSRSERPELFDAARVGLGALGVLSTVTLQTEPAFRLRAVERPLPLEDVLDGMDELVAAHDHVEFYWFPHTDVALVKTDDRTDAPARPVPRLRALVDDELVANGVFALTCRLGTRVPAVVPAVNRAATRLVAERTYTDAAPRVLTSRRRVRFLEMEYALPRAAMPAVLRELRGLPERRGLQVGFPVEVRVAPPEDALLSPAHGRETAYVAVHLYRQARSHAWFEACEPVLRAAGGRPHWGKLHGLDAEQLRAVHPGFDAFTAVRDRLDPDRRFGNAHLARVLGD